MVLYDSSSDSYVALGLKQIIVASLKIFGMVQVEQVINHT